MHCCSFKGKKKEFNIHSKELTGVNENAMAITQIKTNSLAWSTNLNGKKNDEEHTAQIIELMCLFTCI